MKKLSFIILLLFVSIIVEAQLTLDVGTQSSNWGSTSSVNVVDPSTIGKKKVEVLNYSDIDGSPYYNLKWSKAFLYLKNGNLVKINQVKLNMYTNEVDFINSNQTEMVLDAFNFKRIILMKQDDTSKVAAIFECYPDMVDNTKGEAIYRVINTGAVKLLALEKTLLKTGTYDPLLGKDPKSFYTKRFYGISNNGTFIPLKILDRVNIMNALMTHQGDLDWLNTNHNKLRNESEVTAFFEFFNTKKK